MHCMGLIQETPAELICRCVLHKLSHLIQQVIYVRMDLHTNLLCSCFSNKAQCVCSKRMCVCGTEREADVRSVYMGNSGV